MQNVPPPPILLRILLLLVPPRLTTVTSASGQFLNRSSSARRAFYKQALSLTDGVVCLFASRLLTATVAGPSSLSLSVSLCIRTGRTQKEKKEKKACFKMNSNSKPGQGGRLIGWKPHQIMIELPNN